MDAQRPRALILTAAIGAGHEALGLSVGAELEAGGYQTAIDDGLRDMSAPIARVLQWGYAALVLHATPVWASLVWLAARRPFVAAVGVFAGALFGRRLLQSILREQPDLVVSTYPVVTAALGWLRSTGKLRVPVVAVISDVGVHPLWLASGVDLHIVPTEVSASTVRHRELTIRAAHVPVAPTFETGRSYRCAARDSLKIPDDALVALIVGGSLGIGELGEAARVVIDAGGTAIVVTGRNERLRRKLEQQYRGQDRAQVFGWTCRMPELMSAADVIIVNAGGMTCLEARASGLPIVVFRPVPGHGQLNAQALVDAGWATWARTPQELVGALTGAASWRDRPPADSAPSLPSFLDGVAPVMARRRPRMEQDTPGTSCGFVSELPFS